VIPASGRARTIQGAAIAASQRTGPPLPQLHLLQRDADGQARRADPLAEGQQRKRPTT
jgi:hypothetical protein